MKGGALLYQWFLNRIRWIAGVAGLYGTMCALFATLLSIAVLLVVSLIPLYLNRNTEEALGELYCINNYSLIVGFEIPQYNTTFTDTMASGTYTTSSNQPTLSPYVTYCSGPIGVQISGSLSATDTCTFQVLSIISPATPNATVFDSYALSEACYRTLQTCYYDSLLTSCLLSDCIAVAVVNTPVNASYPLTYYRLRCAAKIYYKTRCLDSAASYRLYYSSSQQNSACRQQRLDRINTCLNSTVQLSNVPCLISVSSGRITYLNAICNQRITINPFSVSIHDTTNTNSNSTSVNLNSPSGPLTSTFTSTIFWASDQYDGHVYRISSVNSESYLSNQTGALYCGAVTRTQIASSITTAINSQGS